ncbi:MAG: hypothetical protein RL316_1400 [Bacteroidota bacterium]|jgi:hypothetical protein
MKLLKKNSMKVYFIEAMVNGKWEQVSVSFASHQLAMECYNRGHFYANKYNASRVSSKEL